MLTGPLKTPQNLLLELLWDFMKILIMTAASKQNKTKPQPNKIKTKQQ